MFRTRVIYLWLQMTGAFLLLLLLAAVAAPLIDAEVTIPMVVASFFALMLVAMGIAIAGAFLMLVLLQYLLIAAGTRAGRPAEFGAFRRWLLGYSLVPATLPLLAFGLPAVRENAGLALALLVAWALATVLVWHVNARRLHREWEAGVPY
jgi:hypothetical protein